MSSSSNDGRRTRSSRRTATSSSNNNTLDNANTTNGLHRSTRHTAAAATTSFKNYFQDDDNFDPEIIDVQSTNANDSESLKSSSQSSSRSFRKNEKSNDTTSNQANIEQLESITGLSRTEAASLLEACNNNIERAIEIHFSNSVGSTSNITKQNGTTSKPIINGNTTKQATKRTHNDLEKGDLIPLDEDSCSNSAYTDDNVRAPIPPKMDRLVDYDPYAIELAAQAAKRKRYGTTTFDGFRNMKEEFNDGLSGSSKCFATLFRPPIDLLFDGSFEASKVKACHSNKWLMLNVQCQNDFSSNCLNRDIWSNETVKEIIKANFVFVQLYFDSVEGNKLVSIYNISTYPFVGILDPRTGEKLIQYNANKLDPCSFCEKLYSFLGENEADFKQNTSNSEIIEVADSNKSDDVVVIDKKTNDNSKTYINGFTSEHKKAEKPKRAADILNSNLIETTDDTNSDIIDINNHDEEEELNKKINTYEDESVISKDKYNKMKQASKVDSTQSFSEKDKPVINTTQNEPCTNTSSKNETKLDHNHQPQIIKYQTNFYDKKDCFLRILYPNGDRLDFTTNGESNLKELVDYLINQGFNTKHYELIERLMPQFSTPSSKPTTSANADQQQQKQEAHSILDITNQSRNLFNSNLNLTFKQMKLFPRVFLLLQES